MCAKRIFQPCKKFNSDPKNLYLGSKIKNQIFAKF
jgi:hypothetical protein